MTKQLESQNILYPPFPPLDEEGTLTTASSQETINTTTTLDTTSTINNSTTRETLVPGKFDYVECTHTRKMLQNAWLAIELTEMWSFVEKPIESFMISPDSRVWKISNKMKELGYDNHSGFTFGWTMRQMQFIAQHGEEKFRETYIN